MAKTDDRLLPALVGQVAGKKDIPSDAIPLIIKAAFKKGNSAPMNLALVEFLAEMTHPKAFDALFSALVNIFEDPKGASVREKARIAFIYSSRLENYVHQLEELFLKHPGSAKGRCAADALTVLAEGKGIAPEAVASSRKTIDKGWKLTDGYQYCIVQAAFWTKIRMPRTW